MFGGKKKSYRNEALEIMFLWVPSISKRDLNEFGVLMKYHFDELYDSNIPADEAALFTGSLYFTVVVDRAESNDHKFLKYMGRYAGWLGACAHYLSRHTDLLAEETRIEVESALERARSIILSGQSKTLFEQLFSHRALGFSVYQQGKNSND